MNKFKPIKLLTIGAGIAFAAIEYMGYKNKNLVNKNTDTPINNNENAKISIPQDGILKETDDLPVATIKIKDLGEMQFVLYPSIAPNTVNNFIYLANSKYYDNLYFDRIIKDFIVQGGMDKYKTSQIESYSIKDEFSSLKHKFGIISMSRSLENDSAFSEFFIVTGDCPELDGKYSAFGRITSGLSVLTLLNDADTIENTEMPKKEIIIESITVDTKGQNYPEPDRI